MISGILKTLFYLLLVGALFPARAAVSKYTHTVTPSVSAGETYDDNVFLSAEDLETDYITTVSPGLAYLLQSEHMSLDMSYRPEFVWYAKNTRDDKTRHYASVLYDQKVSQQVEVAFSNTYYLTDDPLEAAVNTDVQGVRDTRNTYQRNIADATIRYLHGPESFIFIGYNNNLLINEDPTLEDGMIQQVPAGLAHYFNKKNSADLNYIYLRADYSKSDRILPARDDFFGHQVDVEYRYRFSEITEGGIGFGYATRDFDGFTQDYSVIDVYVSAAHAFSPDMSLALSVGVFYLQNEITEDFTGSTSELAFTKRLERGEISFRGGGGLDENYLDSENRGLTQFWLLDAGVTYELLENLSAFAGALYREDRNRVGRDWKTARGRIGLAWTFYRWFSLSLNYTYAYKEDDIDINDYTNNRVSLNLTTAKPWKW